MTAFLVLVFVSLVVAVASFVLYRRTSRGLTKLFLAVAALSALAFPAGAVLHNAVDAAFHVEEPVFFLIAVIGAPLGAFVGLLGASITAWMGRRHPA